MNLRIILINNQFTAWDILLALFVLYSIGYTIAGIVHSILSYVRKF